MKKLILSLIAGLILCTPNLSAEVLFELKFDGATGDAERWFKQKGWEFKEEMDDMNPRFENNRVVIESKDDILGVIMKQFDGQTMIQGAKKLRIHWGVEQYPEGADWSGPKSKTRNTREPISVMLFFGSEKRQSGSFYVPDLPYFLSFFLGEKEKADQVYYGNYWQEGGRYYCIPCNGKTGEFVTEVDLQAKFQESFGKNAPPITGITIEVDTQKTSKSGGRHSKAYIESIQILSE